jgi:histidine kinase
VAGLSLLVLFVRQRQRLAALRQRSRQELETVLHQHAQELRTAQDGIVQAAKQADTGLSRSLQHLPQGVVVVDPSCGWWPGTRAMWSCSATRPS